MEDAKGMDRAFILWKLELKRMCRLLPGMIAEAALLLIVMGAITFGVTKLLYRDATVIQIKIAVIEEEENPLTDLALQYIQSMESIAQTCQFLVVTKEEGFSMLDRGTAVAALVLPGGMIDGILHGNNVPVQVYFPQDAGIESALLKELTEAGVGMLRVAQAQIYGIYDTAQQYGVLEQLSVLEADIDRFNLAFALERLALFRTREISVAGNLSIIQYGIAGGVIFFLLLLGMACYPMMQPHTAVLQRQLLREGVSIGRQCFGKWLCGFCSMGIGFGFFMWLVKGILSKLHLSAWMPGGGLWRYLTYLIILLCVTTFVYFIFQVAGNGISAILLLFFLSVVMVYCSGGFLPSAFLPEAVRTVGKFLPTTYLIEAAGSLYLGKTALGTIGILLVDTMLFGLAAYGIRRREKV